MFTSIVHNKLNARTKKKTLLPPESVLLNIQITVDGNNGQISASSGQ